MSLRIKDRVKKIRRSLSWHSSSLDQNNVNFSRSDSLNNGSAVSGSFPPGWESAIDSDGRVYYINHVDNISTYVDPRHQHDVEVEYPETRIVTLTKNSQLGFGFVAGSEKPVVVRCVTEAGPSDELLLPGDQIHKIGSEDVRYSPRGRVIELVRSANSQLVLTVSQPPTISTQGKKSILLNAAKKQQRLKRDSSASRVRFSDDTLKRRRGSINFEPPTPDQLLNDTVLKVYLETNQNRSFKYDTYTRVKDVVSALKSKLDITCIEHFGLVLHNTKSPLSAKMTVLSPQEKIVSFAASLQDDVIKCLFRLVYVPRDAYDLMRKDSTAFQYFYNQCCEDVINERFSSDLKCDVALRLASLHMQQHAIEKGIQFSKITIKVIEKEFGLGLFLNPSMLRAVRPKELRKMLQHFMKLNQGLISPGQKEVTPLQAKLHYLKTVCELKSFGGKCFLATLIDRRAEVMLLIGPKCGISQVTDIKSFSLHMLADFDLIDSIQIDDEKDGATKCIQILLTDENLPTLLLSMMSNDAKDFLTFVEGYFLLFCGNKLPLYDKSLIPAERKSRSRSPPSKISIDHNQNSTTGEPDYATIDDLNLLTEKELPPLNTPDLPSDHPPAGLLPTNISSTLPERPYTSGSSADNCSINMTANIPSKSIYTSKDNTLEYHYDTTPDTTSDVTPSSSIDDVIPRTSARSSPDGSLNISNESNRSMDLTAECFEVLNKLSTNQSLLDPRMFNDKGVYIDASSPIHSDTLDLASLPPPAEDSPVFCSSASIPPPDLFNDTRRPADITSQTADVTSQTADITSQTADIKSQTADIKSQTADITSQTADIMSRPADIMSRPADITSKNADIISRPADIMSRPADITSKTADISSRPAATATILIDNAVEMHDEAESKQIESDDSGTETFNSNDSGTMSYSTLPLSHSSDTTYANRQVPSLRTRVLGQNLHRSLPSTLHSDYNGDGVLREMYRSGNMTIYSDIPSTTSLPDTSIHIRELQADHESDDSVNSRIVQALLRAAAQIDTDSSSDEDDVILKTPPTSVSKSSETIPTKSETPSTREITTSTLTDTTSTQLEAAPTRSKNLSNDTQTAPIRSLTPPTAAVNLPMMLVDSHLDVDTEEEDDHIEIAVEKSTTEKSVDYRKKCDDQVDSTLNVDENSTEPMYMNQEVEVGNQEKVIVSREAAAAIDEALDGLSTTSDSENEKERGQKTEVPKINIEESVPSVQKTAATSRDIVIEDLEGDLTKLILDEPAPQPPPRRRRSQMSASSSMSSLITDTPRSIITDTPRSIIADTPRSIIADTPRDTQRTTTPSPRANNKALTPRSPLPTHMQKPPLPPTNIKSPRTAGSPRVTSPGGGELSSAGDQNDVGVYVRRNDRRKQFNRSVSAVSVTSSDDLSPRFQRSPRSPSTYTQNSTNRGKPNSRTASVIGMPTNITCTATDVLANLVPLKPEGRLSILNKNHVTVTSRENLLDEIVKNAHGLGIDPLELVDRRSSHRLSTASIDSETASLSRPDGPPPSPPNAPFTRGRLRASRSESSLLYATDESMVGVEYKTVNDCVLPDGSKVNNTPHSNTGDITPRGSVGSSSNVSDISKDSTINRYKELGLEKDDGFIKFSGYSGEPDNSPSHQNRSRFKKHERQSRPKTMSMMDHVVGETPVKRGIMSKILSTIKPKKRSMSLDRLNQVVDRKPTGGSLKVSAPMPRASVIPPGSRASRSIFQSVGRTRFHSKPDNISLSDLVYRSSEPITPHSSEIHTSQNGILRSDDRVETPTDVMNYIYHTNNAFPEALNHTQILSTYFTTYCDTVWSPAHTPDTNKFLQLRENINTNARQLISNSKQLLAGVTQAKSSNDNILVNKMAACNRTLARIIDDSLNMLKLTKDLSTFEALRESVVTIGESFSEILQTSEMAAGKTLQDENMMSIMQKVSHLATLLTMFVKTLRSLSDGVFK